MVESSSTKRKLPYTSYDCLDIHSVYKKQCHEFTKKFTIKIGRLGLVH